MSPARQCRVKPFHQNVDNHLSPRDSDIRFDRVGKYLYCFGIALQVDVNGEACEAVKALPTSPRKNSFGHRQSELPP